ncbi:MAG: hypothetical protein U0457_07040 [Candidatus Sericytochromatia bacterium]
MAEIKFSGNDPTFVNFVKEAINIANSNLSTEEKVAKAQDIALQSDGMVNVKERKFLQAFRENPNNIANLKASSLNEDFYLDVKYDPFKKRPTSIDNAFEYMYNNPLGSKVFDAGINRINTQVLAENANPELKLNSLLLNQSNKIKTEANNFINNFNDPIEKKSATAYINELIENRQPKLNSKEIENILSKVNKMAKSDNYFEAVGEPKKLALEALHDIAVPSDISQNRIGSCVVTSLQIQMVLRTPDKYLDMIDTLAKNQIYQAKNGNIAPNWTFYNDYSARTISGAIVQNALMSDALAGNYNSENHGVNQGLHSYKAEKVFQKLFTNSTTLKSSFSNNENNKEQLVKMLISANPSINNPVYISMKFSESGRDMLHAVNVIAIDNQNVTIINPWGREETFDTEMLKDRIKEVLVVNK